MKKYTKGGIVGLLVAVLMVASAVGGTTDKTLGSAGGYAQNYGGIMLERTLDFSSTAHTGTAAEVYQMLHIPAGTMILGVGYEVHTGESGTCTIDVGDGNDADGWFDGANVETGQTATAWAVGTYAGTAVNCTTSVTDNVSAFGTAIVPTVTTYTNVIYDSGAVTGNISVTTYSLSTANAVTGTTANVTSIYPTTAGQPYVDGVFYSSADTIDMTLNNNATALKITIRAFAIPVAGLD